MLWSILSWRNCVTSGKKGHLYLLFPFDGHGNSQKSTTWFPIIAVARSILLKQRNPQMNATASALSLVLKTRSTEVKIWSYCLICEMQIELLHVQCTLLHAVGHKCLAKVWLISGVLLCGYGEIHRFHNFKRCFTVLKFSLKLKLWNKGITGN